MFIILPPAKIVNTDKKFFIYFLPIAQIFVKAQRRALFTPAPGYAFHGFSKYLLRLDTKIPNTDIAL